MIPQFEAAPLATTVPPGHEYWTPQPADIGEEGFGGFRDTWALGRVPAKEARDVLAAEIELVSLADELSDDVETYEMLAGAIEYADATSVPEHLTTGEPWERLRPHLDGYSPLAGLELGVSGLVTTLATLGGCFPAASCRAHSERHSWSPYPVVLLAADEFRVQRLAPYVRESGCGFAVDPARPQLLAIGAPSVQSMMGLAQLVLSNAPTFRRPRSAQRARRPRPSVEQGVLDFDVPQL